MTPLRTTLLLVAGAALLAACSKPAGNTQTASASGAPAAGAAASGPDTVISENDIPHPKPGMWEVTTSSQNGPPTTDRNCVKADEHVDIAKDMQKMKAFCSTFTFKKTFLGDYVIDSQCGMHGVTGTSHIVVHGDLLGGSYTTDSQGSFSMPGRPPMTFTTHTVSHWVGPC